MIEEVIGAYGNRLIIAVVGVGVVLLLLAVGLAVARRRGGTSPFIRGGRNREPRLQVLDAIAVDARRRLVLVRRDDVEHLVMIGGPTDIVIESRIGAAAGVESPRPTDAALFAAPAAHAAPFPPQAEAILAQTAAPTPDLLPLALQAEPAIEPVAVIESPRLGANPAPQLAAAPQPSPTQIPPPLAAPPLSPRQPAPQPAARHEGEVNFGDQFQ